MLTDWSMRIYRSLPICLQELGLSLYARRLDRLYYGRAFDDELRRMADRPLNSAELVGAWQNGRLAAMVAEARRHVPYYRQLLNDHGPVFGRDSLMSLPLLDKQRVRQMEHEFIDERFDARTLFQDKTSGTTGTSLTIFWDRDSLQRMWAAHEIRVRRAVGVDRSMPRAMVGGRSVVPGGTREPPFWRYNRHWKQLYLSSYHISAQWARQYVDAIREAGSVWVTGYGSAIAALAESALVEGLAPLPMRVVVASGDTLQPAMRHSIESFFSCRCYDHYGQSEGLCWIMECTQGRKHVAPEFGILEILDETGHPCAPGVAGEMVATGLLNRGMPLIRYRTGDEAAWAADQTCPCGQPFPIVERLEGRVDDYLLAADGRRIGRLSTAMKASPCIHSAQIVQDQPGHAFLLVKPGTSYQRSAGLRVRADILGRIGPFAIDVLEVAEIPRTPAGKLKLVVRLEGKPQLCAQYEPILGQSRHHC